MGAAGAIPGVQAVCWGPKSCAGIRRHEAAGSSAGTSEQKFEGGAKSRACARVSQLSRLGDSCNELVPQQ